MSFFVVQCATRRIEDRKSVFYYNESNAITTLDPAFARDLETMWATNQLFDGLVELDSLLIPQPCLAHAWRISNDGLEYTFNLRTDVKFHKSELFDSPNNRRLKASDVVFSFNRIRDAKVASPGAWVFEQVAANGIEALNDSTVVIRLIKPFQPFLGMLSTQYANIVPREVVEHFGADFREHPIGTGPFQFAFWYEQIALVFHKNENFWRRDNHGQRLPYLDAVKIDFVKDMSVEYQGLLSGRYDMMSGINASFKDELLTADGLLDPVFDNIIRFQKIPFIKTDYLGFVLDDQTINPNQRVILDVRIREAIECAIDKDAMVKYLRNNTVFAAHSGFVPPVLLGEKDAGKNTYDPERSKRLIAESGYSTEQLNIPLYTTSDYADLLEYIQHALMKVGIKASVQILQTANFKEQTSQAKLPIFRKSWLADYADAENFLGIFKSNRFAPYGPNYMHFKSEEFDELYDQAAMETNDSLRMELYRRMNKFLMNERPVIPLFYDQVSHFVANNVQGLRTNAINMLDLSTVWKQ